MDLMVDTNSVETLAPRPLLSKRGQHCNRDVVPTHFTDVVRFSQPAFLEQRCPFRTYTHHLSCFRNYGCQRNGKFWTSNSPKQRCRPNKSLSLELQLRIGRLQTETRWMVPAVWCQKAARPKALKRLAREAEPMGVGQRWWS
jgi:hypothetical protein